MTTSYLPDLTHLSPETRWLPADLPDRLEADWVGERYDEVLAACDAAGSDPQAWIDVVLRLSELESYLGSRMGATSIAYRQDTADEVVEAEYQRLVREVSPVATDKSVEISRKVVASPCADAIEARFGAVYLQEEEATCRANAPVNTALRTELSEVLMRHTKIFGKATITWRGETHPFSFARKAAVDPDPVERRAAWQSKVDYVMANEEELQAVFDEARALRVKMAENLDMSSFIELRYLEMGRYDWTPDDAARVRAAIREHVVPVAVQLGRRQAAALGTSLVHPADEQMQPQQAPEPIVPVEGQLEAAGSIFREMGPEFSEPWEVLVSERLIDLPAREGKGTGAFCASFRHERVPFIFCNSVGSHDDVTTLMHEYGHAMQVWHSRNIEPAQLRSCTAETAEIHSMTLELLAHPYMETFFGGGADAYRLDHVRGTLEIVPYLASIDDFQHRIYEQGLDAEGRGAAWREVAKQYMPMIDWDADDWYARGRWMLQLHVFQYPFYYLDYALARLVSWELWLDALEDRDAGIEKYLRLCELGGTKPFREAVISAGLGDPFDPATIERTISRLMPHLELE